MEKLRNLENTPCQKCWTMTEVFLIEDGRYLCKSCIKKVEELEDKLRSLPDDKSIEIIFKYSLSSGDWDQSDEEFNGEEKVEILVNDLKDHIASMKFLEILDYCEFKTLEPKEISSSLAKIIIPDLLLDALNLYKTDFMEDSIEGDSDEERRKYRQVKKVHDSLRKNLIVGKEINDKNLGSLIDILDYYIRVREEDLESVSHEEKQQIIIKLLKLKKMSKELSSLL